MKPPAGLVPYPYHVLYSAVLPHNSFTYYCKQALLLAVVFTVASLSIAGFIGCGGGGNSGGGPNPQPSYILSASPSTLSVYPGGSATVTVTGEPSNGFSGTMSVSFGGLPAGVTASPSSFTFTCQCFAHPYCAAAGAAFRQCDQRLQPTRQRKC